MPLDYGLRVRPPAERIGGVLALCAVAIVIFSLAVTQKRSVDADQAEAAYWEVLGPPCPALSGAEFAARRDQAPHGFNFGGVVFSRRYGHVSCSTRPDGPGRPHYPVCEFTSPDDLVISTTAERRYFAPGVGQPATVSVRRGVIRCVLASNFTASSMD